MVSQPPPQGGRLQSSLKSLHNGSPKLLSYFPIARPHLRAASRGIGKDPSILFARCLVVKDQPLRTKPIGLAGAPPQRSDIFHLNTFRLPRQVPFPSLPSSAKRRALESRKVSVFVRRPGGGGCAVLSARDELDYSMGFRECQLILAILL